MAFHLKRTPGACDGHHTPPFTRRLTRKRVPQLRAAARAAALAARRGPARAGAAGAWTPELLSAWCVRAAPWSGAQDNAWVRNAEGDAVRLEALETALEQCLRRACAPGSPFSRPVLTWAGLAGDCVLLAAAARARLLVPGSPLAVVFIDTLHLHPETHALLAECEAAYGFTALRYTPAGCPSKAVWNATYSSDLYMTDPESYDARAKVEPLQRALAELGADCWLNGRRRDHGAERAALPVYEAPASPTGLVKVNPLAHWTFADCFAALDKRGSLRHALHAEGYPSVGDVHSTLPVAQARWFEYGGERLGRFVGLTTAVGGAKTECGIHSAAPGSALPAASSSLRPGV